jgi:hypothetical protein
MAEEEEMKAMLDRMVIYTAGTHVRLLPSQDRIRQLGTGGRCSGMAGLQITEMNEERKWFLITGWGWRLSPVTPVFFVRDENWDDIIGAGRSWSISDGEAGTQLAHALDDENQGL